MYRIALVYLFFISLFVFPIVLSLSRTRQPIPSEFSDSTEKQESFNNMPHIICIPPSSPNSGYNYCPSFGAAVAFAVFFGGVTTAHITEAILYRKTFCWVLIMGASWEVGGFVARAVSVTMEEQSGPAFAAQLLVLLAPLWINAFAYMMLGRIMHFHLPDTPVWGVKAKRLTLIFVLLDICTFLVQAVGAVLTGNGNPAKTVQLGLHIYMGGIGFQELFICIFGALAIRTHITIVRQYSSVPKGFDTQTNPNRTLQSARTSLRTLYVVLVLITIRIIFRLIEFSSGTESYVPAHEWPSYVFDFTVIFIALIVLAIFHPGRFIRGEGSNFPRIGRKQKKMEKAEKKEQATMVKMEKKEAKEREKQQKKLEV